MRSIVSRDATLSILKIAIIQINIAMNLSSPLQQEIEQIATLQGISPDQFILQTLTEKISILKQQMANRSSPTTFNRTESHLREQDGLLVFDTESLNHIDFNQLIDESRWEHLGL